MGMISDSQLNKAHLGKRKKKKTKAAPDFLESLAQILIELSSDMEIYIVGILHVGASL